MIYFTLPRNPRTKQISVLDILDGLIDGDDIKMTAKEKNYTTTHRAEALNEYMKNNDVGWLEKELEMILDLHKELLRVADKSTLYRSFQIPKKSGGWRKIDAPEEKLRAFHDDFLKWLKKAAMNDSHCICYETHHTNAFAYVKNRCTKDAMIKHQYNKSKWYGKTDFSNFFGSITKEFVIQQLKMIYPICSIDMSEGSVFDEALDLCFLNGGLPQGTVISPWLTNLIMIPIDHEITNDLIPALEAEYHDKFVYTRYADDMQWSARKRFDMNKVVAGVNEILKKFNAPFGIKKEKTRIGSNAGSNWNLGIMITRENEMTIGHENINYFKIKCHNFILDHLNGKNWERTEVEQFQGLLNYYKFIQPDRIEQIIAHYNSKYSVDMVWMIKTILKNKPLSLEERRLQETARIEIPAF